MKIIITLETPGIPTPENEENMMEEFELDIIDDIQCGKTSGTLGLRGTEGTWKIQME